MAEPEEQRASSDDLAARIAAAQAARRQPVRNKTGAVRGWEIAFRLVLELVVGIAIGGAMGYGIDWLIGSLPAFTIVFGLLGFAAGVRVMLRSAEAMNRKHQTPSGQTGETDDSGSVRAPGKRQDERNGRGERS
ncbi:MAG: AtpZ/AtpI family protein [Pseudomonadota bacterium]